MTNALPPGLTDCLLWSPEQGYGWHGRAPIAYTGDYWTEYRQRDATAMGAELTRARLELVLRHFDGQVLDIGIGGGRFVTEAAAQGYDINPDAVAWLHQQGRYCDPYRQPVAAISCWDSLEHIPDPAALLAQVTGWLFVSLPTFRNEQDCLTSRHFKPGEHLWYFTEPGFIRWCEAQGFELVEMNREESAIGREGITSFAMRRHGQQR